MTTAQIVNRILEKLRTSRVEFIRIDNDFDEDFQVIDFKFGCNEYRAVSEGENVMVRRIAKRAEGKGVLLTSDNYSQWVSGVLNGMVRNDAGELYQPND